MKDIRRKTVRELLSEPSKYAGSEVDVKGWVRTRRGNKNVQFVALNDGSTINSLQIVFDLSRFSEESLKTVTTGSSIHVQGLRSRVRERVRPLRFRRRSLRFMERRILRNILCRRKVILLNFCVR